MEQENEYGPLRREYAKLASQYDERWKSYVAASIRTTIERVNVSGGGQILDVGCGTGVMLEALSLAAPNAQLTGVDLSTEMLEVARRRLGSSIVLKQGYAEALPFEDGEFDLLVSTNVFHFIQHPRLALREMRRVLRPSGRLVITDWCDDYLACRICDLFLRVVSSGHFRTYGSKECRRLLEQEGFGNVDIQRYKIDWFWGLMTATGDR